MSKTHRQHRRPRRDRRRKQEGAAMIIVMAILLSVTALAVFAVHATSFEIRASGYSKQAMQTRYVAESGLTAALSYVDSAGPGALRDSIDQQTAIGKPGMSPYEPELGASKDGYRFHSSDFVNYSVDPAHLPISTEASAGARQAYTPFFLVDVNDHYINTRVVAGQRSDGRGRLRYLHATYTARGRMRLASDYTSTSVAAGGVDPRDYHEAASDARAYGISGPFGL